MAHEPIRRRLPAAHGDPQRDSKFDKHTIPLPYIDGYAVKYSFGDSNRLIYSDWDAQLYQHGHRDAHTHLHLYGHTDGDFYVDAFHDAERDGEFDKHTVTLPDPYGLIHINGNGDPDRDLDGVLHRYADSFVHTDEYADGHAVQDAVRHPQRDRVIHRHAHADAVLYAEFHGHSLPDADGHTDEHAGASHGDVHPQLYPDLDGYGHFHANGLDDAFLDEHGNKYAIPLRHGYRNVDAIPSSNIHAFADNHWDSVGHTDKHSGAAYRHLHRFDDAECDSKFDKLTVTLPYIDGYAVKYSYGDSDGFVYIDWDAVPHRDRDGFLDLDGHPVQHPQRDHVVHCHVHPDVVLYVDGFDYGYAFVHAVADAYGDCVRNWDSFRYGHPDGFDYADFVPNGDFVGYAHRFGNAFLYAHAHKNQYPGADPDVHLHHDPHRDAGSSNSHPFDDA
jgi:hypothetical protein